MNAKEQFLMNRQARSVYENSGTLWHQVTIHYGPFVERYQFWYNNNNWYFSSETHYLAKKLDAKEIHHLAVR